MRKSRAKQLWFFFFVLLAIIAMGLLASFPVFSPELPRVVDATSVVWKTYTDSRLNYSIDYPDAYRVEVGDRGGDVSFVSNGSRLVVVSHLTEQEADERGLWADHQPAADIQLGGRAGKRYDYNHFDILAGVQTISFVVPYKDKFLAVEFRLRKVSILEEFGLILTKPRELSDVERRILDSFTWR